jgi:enoyl-CoA hydratase/carnithine racemase
MTYEEIRYEARDGVLTITLDRPDRLNAFTARMAEELIDAFNRADADDEVRAVVLTGAGRGFCAGADLGRGGATFAYPEGTAHRDHGGQVSLRIFESPQAGHRRGQRPGGRDRRHDDIAGRRPAGLHDGAVRARVRPARHRP